MNNERFVDFLFAGVSVVPAALTFSGHVGMAMLIVCPLLIATCLTAAYLEGDPSKRP